MDNDKTVSCIDKKSVVDEWVADGLRNKIREASITVQQTQKPILLYRNIVEENEDAIQEQVGIITEKNHVIVVLYAYGGLVPSTFQKVNVYTTDKFVKWLLKKENKQVLLQCLEEIVQ